MLVRDVMKAGERMLVGLAMKSRLAYEVPIGRAEMVVRHRRLRRKGTIYVMEDVGPPTLSRNLITNVGRVQLHTQGYGTSGLSTNGFNWIALSNDALTETSASTTLSNEIVANGLSRAQGTVTLASGSGNVTTIDKTFTATGSQSAQKGALLTASSSGVMNHPLVFTQRALITGDTLQTTFSITLG